MKNKIINFLIFPWKFLIGFLITIFTFSGLFIIFLSMPYAFGLSLAIGWKILIGIGYIYLFGLWCTCIINVDDVLYFASNLMHNDS